MNINRMMDHYPEVFKMMELANKQSRISNYYSVEKIVHPDQFTHLSMCLENAYHDFLDGEGGYETQEAANMGYFCATWESFVVGKEDYRL